MASLGETSRPGFVYDQATDTWIPIGIGSHSHTAASIGAIANTLFTAKGDLAVGTGSGTVTNRTVGSDGSLLVADSTQASGLNWAAPSIAGKNCIINGGFDFWQRGTSAYAGTPTANTPFYFGADRWFYATGTGSNSVRFERTTADTPGLQYGIKYGRNAGASGTAPTILGHVIESVNCKPLNGKTVTVSFYAKKLSNFTGENFFCQLVTGTGTDQGSQQLFISWTGGAQAGIVTPTLTTTMQRFSFTATVPNGTNEMCVFFPFYTAQPSTAAADEYIQIEGVQVELGSVATPFSRTGGTYSSELAACQRYYFRTSYSNQNQANARHGQGAFASSTVAYCFVQHPVPMRVSATAVDYANLALYDYGTDRAVTSVSIQGNCNNEFGTLLNCAVSTGGTQYRPVQLENFANSAGYLGLNAEL